MTDEHIIQGAIGILYRDTPRRRVYLVTHNILSDNHTFPGGACVEGETPIEAIKRELLEEINFQASDDLIEELPLTNSFMFSIPGSPGHKQPAKYSVFLVRSETDHITPNNQYVSKAIWLPYEQARGMVKHEILRLNLDWIERHRS